MTKKNKLSSQKRLAIAGFFAIFIALLFMISSVPATAGTGHQQETGFTTSVNYIPSPQLNTNITWSTHNSTWGMLEYNNGTHLNNLTAGLSTQYANPITINPKDIVAPGVLQNEKLGTGSYWNNSANWGWGESNTTNQTRSISTTTNNGVQEIQITDKLTGNPSTNPWAYINIPNSDYASQNPNYDYITFTGEYTAPANSHSKITIAYGNETRASTIGTSTPNTPLTTEHNLGNLPTKFNTTAGKGYSKDLEIQIALNVPSTATTGTYTITIYSLSMTTYPIQFGTNSKGTIITNGTGNMELKSFKPNFKYKEIADEGYSIAVSQPLQNLTTQQNEISGNPKYVEQVTYQGNYFLPSAPDLSYSNSIISEMLSINASQTTVLDINGLSLLNAISGKNGNVTLMTVNPNQKTTLIQIVDYTSTQWTTVSGPPGFFSVNGILYYFDEIVLGIIAVVGLAGGAAVARTRSLRRVK